jgi:hypothetical protein
MLLHSTPPDAVEDSKKRGGAFFSVDLLAMIGVAGARPAQFKSGTQFDPCFLISDAV